MPILLPRAQRIRRMSPDEAQAAQPQPAAEEGEQALAMAEIASTAPDAHPALGADGEVPLCRVCHGESEPGRELFHPCKCDGTIKHIHQDCLVEWLKHSRQKNPKCELCGTPFRFQNVYKEGAPLRLTLLEVVYELVPRTVELITIFCSYAFFTLLWAAFVPVFSALMLRFDWCLVSEQANHTCFDRIVDSIDSLGSILTAWYNGVVTICVMVTVTFFAFEVGRVAYRELFLIEKSYVIRLIDRELKEALSLMDAVHDMHRNFRFTVMEVALGYVEEETTFLLKIRDEHAQERRERLLMAATELCNVASKWEPAISTKRFLCCDPATGIVEWDNSVTDSSYFFAHLQQLDRLCALLRDMHTASYAPHFLMLSEHMRGVMQYEALCATFMCERETDSLRASGALRQHLIHHHAPASQLVSLVYIRDAYRLYRAREAFCVELRKRVQDVKPIHDQFHAMRAEVAQLRHEMFAVAGQALPAQTEEGTKAAPAGSEHVYFEVLALLLLQKHRAEERFVFNYAPPSTPATESNADAAPTQATVGADTEELHIMPHHAEQSVEEICSGIHSDVRQVMAEVVDCVVMTAEVEQEQEQALEAAETLQMMERDPLYAAMPPHAREETHRVGGNGAPQYTRNFDALFNADNEDGIEAQAERAEHAAPQVIAAGDEIAPVGPVAVGAGDHGALAVPPVDDAAAVAGPVPQLQANILPELALGDAVGYDHFFLFMLYIFFFLFITIQLPSMLGHAVLEYTALLERTTAHITTTVAVFANDDSNVQLLSRLLDYHHSNIFTPHTAERAHLLETFVFKLHACLATSVGYFTIVATAIVGYGAYSVKYLTVLPYSYFSPQAFIVHHTVAVFSALNLFAKAIVTTVLYVLVLPLGSACLMLLSVYPVLHRQQPLGAVLRSGEDLPVVLFLFLYILAYFLIAHVLYVTSELRLLVHPGYLTTLYLPPNLFRAMADHQPVGHIARIQQQLDAHSYMDIIKIFVVQVIVILVGILVHVIVPLRCGSVLALSFTPLSFRSSSTFSEVEIPVEMIMSHIFIPLLIDKLQYASSVASIVRETVFFLTGLLGLDHILAPDAQQRRLERIVPLPQEGDADAGEEDEEALAGPEEEANAEAHAEANAAGMEADAAQAEAEDQVNIQQLLMDLEREVTELEELQHEHTHSDQPLLMRSASHESLLEVERELLDLLQSNPDSLALSYDSADEHKEAVDLGLPTADSETGDSGVKETSLPDAEELNSLALVQVLVAQVNEYADRNRSPVPPAAAAVPLEQLEVLTDELQQLLSLHEAAAESESQDYGSFVSQRALLLDEEEDEVVGPTAPAAPGPTPAPAAARLPVVVDEEHDGVNQLVYVHTNVAAAPPAAFTVMLEAAEQAYHRTRASCIRGDVSEGARLTLMMVGLCLIFAVLASALLHWPLILGRYMLALMRLPVGNDVFNYPVGLFSCYAVGMVGRVVVQDMARNMADLRHVAGVVAKWALLIAKVGAAGLAWIVIPPLLLGYALEVLFMVPLQLSLHETPIFPFFQAWGLGLVLFKLAVRCVLTGVMGDIELRTQMEMVLIRGFAQFDLPHFWWSVFVPVVLPLLDLVCVPFFFSRLLGTFVETYAARTLLARFSCHVYIALRVLCVFASSAVSYLVALHNEIRDTRYLVGTQLTNHSR